MITPEERQKLLDFVNSLEVEKPKPHKPTKISELKEKEVIQTETEAEYYRISILLHLAGKQWCSGSSYLITNYWVEYNNKSCFHPRTNTRNVLDYYKREGYTIIPSTQITDI